MAVVKSANKKREALGTSLQQSANIIL